MGSPDYSSQALTIIATALVMLHATMSANRGSRRSSIPGTSTITADLVKGGLTSRKLGQMIRALQFVFDRVCRPFEVPSGGTIGEMAADWRLQLGDERLRPEIEPVTGIDPELDVFALRDAEKGAGPYAFLFVGEPGV